MSSDEAEGLSVADLKAALDELEAEAPSAWFKFKVILMIIKGMMFLYLIKSVRGSA
jgi:hypothetical protein